MDRVFVSSPRALLSVGSGPQGDESKYLLATTPKSGGHHPKNWKAAGIFSTRAVALRSSWYDVGFLCSIVWVAGASFHRSCSAFHSFPRLCRFLGVLSKPRLAHLSLSHSALRYSGSHSFQSCQSFLSFSRRLDGGQVTQPRETLRRRGPLLSQVALVPFL